MRVLIEVVGWMAALMVLTSYVLLSLGRLQGRSIPYQLLNLLGSMGFVINSGWNGAWPSAGLNLVWMGFGVFTLWKMRRDAAKAPP